MKEEENKRLSILLTNTLNVNIPAVVADTSASVACKLGFSRLLTGRQDTPAV